MQLTHMQLGNERSSILSTLLQSVKHILKHALIPYSDSSYSCLCEADNSGSLGSDIWSSSEAIYLALNYWVSYSC